MTVQNLADNGQPQPGALSCVSAVRNGGICDAVEAFCQAGQVMGSNARPVIGHAEQDACISCGKVIIRAAAPGIQADMQGAVGWVP